MSLINKMLQDLDARGNARSAGVPADIKPVPRREDGLRARLPLRRIAAITAALLVVALGVTAWGVLPIKGKTYDAPPAAQPAAPAPPAPGPAPVTVAEVAPAPTAPGSAASAPGQVPAAQPSGATPEARVDTAAARSAAATAAPATTAKAAAAPARRALPQAAPKAASDAARTKAAAGASAGVESTPAAPGEQGRADSGQGAGQGAEIAYRRALAGLQEGRVSEAIAGLQAALRISPKHDAARQTLVGLLVEQNRGDEAMGQLQQALTLDPRQPALAMLLARLQIERGKSGIDTLLHTLPYAAGSGDYAAFLAGALQRQGRYGEAAAQYQAALHTAPANAVWWMGLGIALQADKRNAEALDAFRQARALGTLSPDLQSFVERRLEQLAR
ncbi:MAG: biosis protein MshN [Massilia sp.]|jgi:MSHA biogenesis protein MshN